MSYKREVKNAMNYYNYWIDIYKQEKEIERNDIEEIALVIKQLKIEISNLYKKLNSINQTKKEDIEIYQLIRNKEEEKRFLKRDKQDSENATDFNGKAITTATEMLKKFELLIKREFGTLNADSSQIEQEKINALNKLKGMKIYSMCEKYIEEYICDFRKNY